MSEAVFQDELDALPDHLRSTVLVSEEEPQEQAEESVEESEDLLEVAEEVEEADPADSVEDVEAPEEEETETVLDERDRAINGLREEVVNLRKNLRSKEDEVSSVIKELRDKMVAAENAKAAAEHAVAVPDKDEDPVAYLEYQQQKANADIAHRLDSLQEAQTKEELDRALMQTVQTVEAMQNEFAAEHPDYYDAYSEAKARRVALYTASGYDEQQALAAVSQEEANLALNALQRGENPAELVYKIAQESFGWTPKPVAVPEKDNVTEKVDTIKKGMEAQSLSEVKTRKVGSGQIDQARFDKLPYDEKIQLMQDDAKFEELMKTGATTWP